MLSSSQIDNADWQNSIESGIQINNSISSFIRKSVVSLREPTIDPEENDVIINTSIYTENSSGSGSIYPVKSRHGKIRFNDDMDLNDFKHEEDDEQQSSKPLLGSISPKLLYIDNVGMKTENKVAVVFLMVQGMFAGFSFVTLFSTVGGEGINSESFLLSYGQRAGDLRRYMYLLSSFSVLGSLDKLMAATDMSTLGEEEYRLSRITMALLGGFLHVLAFLATVIISKTDTLLTLNYGYATDSTSTWVVKAKEDVRFRSDMIFWLGLDRTRLISACLAWVVACILVYSELKSRDRLEQRRQETEKQLQQWKRKVDELNGHPQVFEHIAQIPGADRTSLTAAAASLRKLKAVQQVFYCLPPLLQYHFSKLT